LHTILAITTTKHVSQAAHVCLPSFKLFAAGLAVARRMEPGRARPAKR
jgi:hypothetical protein